MRLFIAVIILIFSLQSWTKADDISDFEIEGMSIGDSLLDHFTKDQINNNQSVIQPDDKNFKKAEFYKKDFLKTYESIDIRYNKKTYKINGITGIFYFRNNDFYKCHNKRRLIDNDIQKMFPKIQPQYYEEKLLEEDPSGNSFWIVTSFNLKKSEVILTACSNYTEKLEKERELWDHLIVGLMKF